MNVSSGKWSTVCAGLLTAAALVSAPSASADPADDQFLGALSNYGIVMNNDNAIAMAHAVCAGFDKNANSNYIAMKVSKEASLTLRQSGFFVGASMSAYCPQFIGKTDDSLHWLDPFPPLM